MGFIFDQKNSKTAKTVVVGYDGNEEIITVPERITKIRDGAFAECKTIKRIIFPGEERMISFGIGVFRDCSNLESVTIMSKFVVSLEDGMFEGCTNLKEVLFNPSSKVLIGIRTFAGCSNLSSIDLEKLQFCNGSWCSGCSMLANENGMVIRNGVLYGMINPVNELTIPSSIRRINEDALSYSSLEKVSFEKGSSAEIGPRAFRFSQSLVSMSLPEKIKYIGGDAFYQCNSLKKIEIPRTLTNLSGAFNGCDALETVILNNGLKILGPYCFSYCSSLKEITIPETVTAIKEAAFLGCDSLERIIVLSEKTKIDSGILKASFEKDEECNTVIIASPAIKAKLPQELVRLFQPLPGTSEPEGTTVEAPQPAEVYCNLGNPSVKAFIDCTLPDFDFEAPQFCKDKTYKLMANGTAVQIKTKLTKQIVKTGKAIKRFRCYDLFEAERNYLSRGEVVKLIEEIDPNYRSDAAYYATAEIKQGTPKLNEDEMVYRFLFFAAIAARIHDEGILALIAKNHPQKAKGGYNLSKIQRIACAPFVTDECKVLQLFAKAADDHSLTVEAGFRRFSPEEMAQIKNDLLSYHADLFINSIDNSRNEKREG